MRQKRSSRVQRRSYPTLPRSRRLSRVAGRERWTRKFRFGPPRSQAAVESSQPGGGRSRRLASSRATARYRSLRSSCRRGRACRSRVVWCVSVAWRPLIACAMVRGCPRIAEPCSLREGGLRRDRRQVPRREERRTDGLVGAVVVALVRIGAAELFRIDMAMRQQLLLAIPSDTARRQRRRDCSVADGVAWWGCASRPRVRADTSSARTAALGVVVVQCQEGRPA